MACGQKCYGSTEHTEDTDHRNLNGIYTDGLGLPVGKKSLEEIFNEIWPLARNNLSLSLHKHNL